MMTSRKIDKIMKNVMLMYQAEAVKEFASYPDTLVEFSPEFENNNHFSFNGDVRNEILVKYDMQYIPEGYILNKVMIVQI